MSGRVVLLAALALPALATPHAAADAQLWVEASARARPTKRLDVDASMQVRFDEDVSRLSAILPEVTLHRRFRSWFRAGGGYRLEYERDGSGDLVLRHRLSIDGRLRIDRGPVRLDYRCMVAEQIRPASGNQYRAVFRNRIDVSYRGLDDWQPWIGVELFHVIDDLDQFDHDRTRFTVGLSRDVGDHEVSAFLRTELHADPMDPTSYILGLGYHHDL